MAPVRAEVIWAVVRRLANTIPRSVPETASTSLVCRLSFGASSTILRRSGSDFRSCSAMVFSPLENDVMFVAWRC
jgi:hypothetical protein